MTMSVTQKKNTLQLSIIVKTIGVQCKISSHWEKGGKGAADLAEEVA